MCRRESFKVPLLAGGRVGAPEPDGSGEAGEAIGVQVSSAALPADRLSARGRNKLILSKSTVDPNYYN